MQDDHKETQNENKETQKDCKQCTICTNFMSLSVSHIGGAGVFYLSVSRGQFFNNLFMMIQVIVVVVVFCTLLGLTAD